MSFTRIDSLISWAEHHGAHFHVQVEVYNDPQHGVSLRVRSPQQSGHLVSPLDQSSSARQGLPSKSRIVSCPFGLSLSFLNALNKVPELQSHSARFPAIFLETLEAHVIGHFFLIQQYLNSETSHWGPYIRSLPQPEDSDKLGTPLYFTETDVAWIRGTDLESARNLRQKTWKFDWESGCRILDTSSGWEQWRGRWTWDLYKWAATIFSSRSFISTLIPEEILTLPITHGTRSFDGMFPVLFPLLDLANHSSTAKVTWFTNVRNEPKDLSIIAESEIANGHQVFNNYAPKNNTELMLGYGFCIPGNDEVSIAFKPLEEDLRVIRKQHLACVEFHGVDAKQTIFHVRAAPYARPPDDLRLAEFRLIEDGGVDALSVLAANRREREYMILHPNQCPERSSETGFMGPLSRNILKVLSLLLERLEGLLENIRSAGEHLGAPATSCQHSAKIYRDGQVFVLQTVTRIIQLRLDAAISQQFIRSHLDGTNHDDARFIGMRRNVELVSLESAFNWLHMTYPIVHEDVTKAIAKELEVSASPELDWIELLNAGWDYTLWCLWIYIVLSLSTLEILQSTPSSQVSTWIKQMLHIYNPDGKYSGWPFQSFHGDKDEEETLGLIVKQFGQRMHLETSSFKPIGGVGSVNETLINFASTIAMEEAFSANVEMKTGGERLRIHQRVLFMAKYPGWDGIVKEQSLSR